jgi:hypothetical protein
MGYPGSAPSSIDPLLARWRSSLDDEPPRLEDALRSEAARCFRLAQGIASLELADELEAIGRAFESEAEELEGANSKPRRKRAGRAAPASWLRIPPPLSRRSDLRTLVPGDRGVAVKSSVR